MLLFISLHFAFFFNFSLLILHFTMFIVHVLIIAVSCVQEGVFMLYSHMVSCTFSPVFFHSVHNRLFIDSELDLINF